MFITIKKGRYRPRQLEHLGAFQEYFIFNIYEGTGKRDCKHLLYIITALSICSSGGYCEIVFFALPVVRAIVHRPETLPDWYPLNDVTVHVTFEFLRWDAVPSILAFSGLESLIIEFRRCKSPKHLSDTQTVLWTYLAYFVLPFLMTAAADLPTDWLSWAEYIATCFTAPPTPPHGFLPCPYLDNISFAAGNLGFLNSYSWSLFLNWLAALSVTQVTCEFTES